MGDSAGISENDITRVGSDMIKIQSLLRGKIILFSDDRFTTAMQNIPGIEEVYAVWLQNPNMWREWHELFSRWGDLRGDIQTNAGKEGLSDNTGTSQTTKKQKRKMLEMRTFAPPGSMDAKDVHTKRMTLQRNELKEWVISHLLPQLHVLVEHFDGDLDKKLEDFTTIVHSNWAPSTSTQNTNHAKRAIHTAPLDYGNYLDTLKTRAQVHKRCMVIQSLIDFFLQSNTK